MAAEYKKQIDEYEQQIKSNRFIALWIGIIKLILVILSLYFLYQTIRLRGNNGYFLVVSIASFVGFWFWQEQVHKKIEAYQNAITIYQRYLDRISGDWIHFTDTGEEYIEEEHLYSSDLDVLGKKSLFQFLNITNTYHGRKQFISDLLKPNYNKQEIEQRQIAIQELYEKHTLVNTIEKHTFEIGTSDKILKVIKMLSTKDYKVIPNFVQKIVSYLPFVSIVCFVIGMTQMLLPLVIIGGVGIAVQGFTWILSIPKVQTKLQAISKVPFSLREYNQVFAILYQQDFTSEKLKDMQSRIGEKEKSTMEAMKELEKIISMISVSRNVLVYGVFNILFLWDIRCYMRYYQWQKRYGEQCESWFTMLGELESMMCFSILPIVVGEVTMPTILENNKTFEAIGLGHPLLPRDKRVCNNYSTKQHIHIISGSNMSGKTTFMRTIGMNMLLARTGSYVCAKKMATSIFTLASSMRIIDNLNEGVSTFYAELRNIKKIIEATRNNENVFFMIDEIFRGTNSKDRLEGARLVLEQLAKSHATGIITTHDLELCHLDKEYPLIENYHFYETYTDTGITFTYTLEKGISTTTNARYLMRMLGILGPDKKL